MMGLKAAEDIKGYFQDVQIFTRGLERHISQHAPQQETQTQQINPQQEIVWISAWLDQATSKTNTSRIGCHSIRCTAPFHARAVKANQCSSALLILFSGLWHNVLSGWADAPLLYCAAWRWLWPRRELRTALPLWPPRVGHKNLRMSLLESSNIKCCLSELAIQGTTDWFYWSSPVRRLISNNKRLVFYYNWSVSHHFISFHPFDKIWLHLVSLRCFSPPFFFEDD